VTQRCPACGKKLDPLRAGHVAIFDDRFHYFCDRGCREDWLEGGRPNRSSYRPPSFASLVPPPIPPPPPAIEVPSPQAPEVETPRPDVQTPVAHDDAVAVDASPPPALPAVEAPIVEDAGKSLLAVGFICGLLGVTLLLAGPSSVVEATRIAVAFAGWIALAVRAFALPRPATDTHPVLGLAPGLLAVVVAGYTWLVASPAHVAAATYAGLAVTVTALASYLVERSRRSVRCELQRLVIQLGDEMAADFRAGETVLVEAPGTVPVDGTVVEGEATVVPWPLANETVAKKEGDPVVAGAEVVEGSIRVLASATGRDRAWARVALDPRGRADVHASLARLARVLTTLGAFVLAALLALSGFANDAGEVELLLGTLSGFAALGITGASALVGIHVARGVLAAQRRGIAYRAAKDWDKAASASLAVFSARGTLLLDEPELTDLEVLGPYDDDRVLSLVAGVESAKIGDPIALAIHRAAAARSLRPDAVRSPTNQPGLGVTAVASTGELLLVGSRALMLREKVSIAAAEATVAKMEAHGRTVLLVALGGKLIAVLGLQDALRQGARAAVQHVLDAHIEPVLLSGDSRETCEAIGRALDIEHLRPEILPADRAREVERLAGGYAMVAVIGRAGRDDAALAAAGVAVALGAAGTATNEWGASLASCDVRDGALALTLAQRARLQATIALLLSIGPGVLASLAVAFGVLAPAYVLIAVLVGTLLAAFHARATDPLASS